MAMMLHATERLLFIGRSPLTRAAPSLALRRLGYRLIAVPLQPKRVFSLAFSALDLNAVERLGWTYGASCSLRTHQR
jgi:hypothetical protein